MNALRSSEDPVYIRFYCETLVYANVSQGGAGTICSGHKEIINEINCLYVPTCKKNKNVHPHVRSTNRSTHPPTRIPTHESSTYAPNDPPSHSALPNDVINLLKPI